jgi:hypothetical protein
MHRIVLERQPNQHRPQLPPYSEISSKPIADAAADWDAARAELLERKRSLTELEQTREAAEWRDAEAAEKARAEGKAEPKRSHVAEHDKKLDQARHEMKVATIAEDRAFTGLQVALDEHQAEWAESVEADVQGLDEVYAAAVDQLVRLHAQRSSALAVRRLVGGRGRRGMGAIGFKPSQIRDLDFAAGTNDRQNTGWVATGDVLAALADLGMPEQVPDAAPAVRPLPSGHGSNLLRGQAGVEEEIAERGAFAEHASSPERVQARQKRQADRRRAREEADAALAASD